MDFTPGAEGVGGGGLTFMGMNSGKNHPSRASYIRFFKLYLLYCRVDVDVYVLSQWRINDGKESEESIFIRLKLKLSIQDCGVFRELALLSGNATLYGHYCPEGDYRACWDAFTRDDRLGELQQIDNKKITVIIELQVLYIIIVV